AMVISHDRWFLDRIATHILDYGDEGKVEFFEGNFTEYEDWKKRTLGAEALEPHRIKYKNRSELFGDLLINGCFINTHINAP
ncbi:hypothetical protein INQ16_27655, partial [Escherichia coli]|nr:hypothetical protein [Escherichia coli]